MSEEELASAGAELESAGAGLKSAGAGLEATGEVEDGEKPRGYMGYDEWVAAGKDPAQWRDLETWKQKGEDYLPFVQKERDELRKEIGALKEEVSTVVEQQKKITEKQTQEAYDKAKQEYEAKLKEAKEAKYRAMEDMDGQAMRRADEQEERLRQEAPQPPGQGPRDVPASDPDFNSWRQENDWYKPESATAADKAMAGYARDVSVDIQQRTGLSGRALYDKVTEAVKQEFPHKFENQKRYGSQAVEGGSPGASKKQKGYKDLPNEAKQAITKFMDRNPSMDKKRLIAGYVQEYFPEG